MQLLVSWLNQAAVILSVDTLSRSAWVIYSWPFSDGTFGILNRLPTKNSNLQYRRVAPTVTRADNLLV